MPPVSPRARKTAIECRQPVDERVNEPSFAGPGVSAGLADGSVELGIGIARQRDQAEARMLLA